MLDVNFFDELRIGLATADDIRQWSHGEVKPETINYRRARPRKGRTLLREDLRSDPDWECYCGKYKRGPLQGHHL